MFYFWADENNSETSSTPEEKPHRSRALPRNSQLLADSKYVFIPPKELRAELGCGYEQNGRKKKICKEFLKRNWNLKILNLEKNVYF